MGETPATIGLYALITRWGGGNNGIKAVIKALESGHITPRNASGAKAGPEASSKMISGLRRRLEISQ